MIWKIFYLLTMTVQKNCTLTPREVCFRVSSILSSPSSILCCMMPVISDINEESHARPMYNHMTVRTRYKATLSLASEAVGIKKKESHVFNRRKVIDMTNGIHGRSIRIHVPFRVLEMVLLCCPLSVAAAEIKT